MAGIRTLHRHYRRANVVVLMLGKFSAENQRRWLMFETRWRCVEMLASR